MEEGYYAGLSPAVTGITEVGVGVRLHRWRCSARGTGSGDFGDGEESRLTVDPERDASPGALVVAGTDGHAVSNAESEGVTRGVLSAVPWLERERQRDQELRGGGGTDDIGGDPPPPTLKLELICVQESDCNDDCDSMKGTSTEQDTAGVPFGVEGNPSHDSVDGAGRGEGEAGGNGGHILRRSDSRSSSAEGSFSYRTGATSPSSSTTSGGDGNSDSGRKASVTISTPNEQSRDQHRGNSSPAVYQCEVTWCGRSVGGTSAPPAGLPSPRWEGQVFYLPLSAADAFNGDGTETLTDDTCIDGQSGDHLLRPDSGLLQPPPPLLDVTLNRSGGFCLYPRMIGSFLACADAQCDPVCAVYNDFGFATNRGTIVLFGAKSLTYLFARWITRMLKLFYETNPQHV